MNRHQVYVVLAVLLVVAGVYANWPDFYRGALIGAGVVFGYIGAVELAKTPAETIPPDGGYKNYMPTYYDRPPNPGCGHVECDYHDECWGPDDLPPRR